MFTGSTQYILSNTAVLGIVLLVIGPAMLFGWVTSIENEADREPSAAPNAGNVCPRCKAPVMQDLMSCPNCGLSLKEKCPSCGQIVGCEWQVCAGCGQTVLSEWRVCVYCNNDFPEQGI